MTNSPSLFSGEVIRLISAALLGEKAEFPVIRAYLACLKEALEDWKRGSLRGRMVVASRLAILENSWDRGLKSVLVKRLFTGIWRSKPNSSKANANGTTPPLIYSEYTIITPVERKIRC